MSWVGTEIEDISFCGELCWERLKWTDWKSLVEYVKSREATYFI